MVRATTRRVLPSTAVASGPVVIAALDDPEARYLCVNFGSRIDVFDVPVVSWLRGGPSAPFGDFDTLEADALLSLPTSGWPIVDVAAVSVTRQNTLCNALLVLDEGGGVNMLSFRRAASPSSAAADEGEADENDAALQVVRHFALAVPSAIWPRIQVASSVAPATVSSPSSPGLAITTTTVQARPRMIVAPRRDAALLYRNGFPSVRLLLNPAGGDDCIAQPSMTPIDQLTRISTCIFTSVDSLVVLQGTKGGAASIVTDFYSPTVRYATLEMARGSNLKVEFCHLGAGAQPQQAMLFSRRQVALIVSPDRSRPQQHHWIDTDALTPTEQVVAVAPVPQRTASGALAARSVVLTTENVYLHSLAAPSSVVKVCSIPPELARILLKRARSRAPAWSVPCTPDVNSAPVALLTLPGGVWAIRVPPPDAQGPPATGGGRWLLRTCGAATALAVDNVTGCAYVAGAHGTVRAAATGVALPAIAELVPGEDGGSVAVSLVAQSVRTRAIAMVTAGHIHQLQLASADDGEGDDAAVTVEESPGSFFGRPGTSDPAASGAVLALADISGGTACITTDAVVVADETTGATCNWSPSLSIEPSGDETSHAVSLVHACVVGATSPILVVAASTGVVVVLRYTSGAFVSVREWRADGLAAITAVGAFACGPLVHVLLGAQGRPGAICGFHCDAATGNDVVDFEVPLPPPDAAMQPLGVHQPAQSSPARKQPEQHDEDSPSDAVHSIATAVDGPCACAVVSTVHGAAIAVFPATEWNDIPGDADAETLLREPSDKDSACEKPPLRLLTLHAGLPAAPSVAIAPAKTAQIHRPSQTRLVRRRQKIVKRRLRQLRLTGGADDERRKQPSDDESPQPSAASDDPQLPDWPSLVSQTDQQQLSCVRLLVLCPGVGASEHVLACTRAPEHGGAHVPCGDDVQTVSIAPPLDSGATITSVAGLTWGPQRECWMAASSSNSGVRTVHVWARPDLDERHASLETTVTNRQLTSRGDPLAFGTVVTTLALLPVARRLCATIVPPAAPAAVLATACSGTHVAAGCSTFDLAGSEYPLAMAAIPAAGGPAAATPPEDGTSESPQRGADDDVSASRRRRHTSASILVGCEAAGGKGSLVHLALDPLRLLGRTEVHSAVVGLSASADRQLLVVVTPSRVELRRLTEPLQPPVATWLPAANHYQLTGVAAPTMELAHGNPKEGSYTALVGSSHGLQAVRLEQKVLAPEAAASQNATAAAAAASVGSAASPSPPRGDADGDGAAQGQLSTIDVQLRLVCRDRQLQDVDLVTTFAPELRATVKRAFAAIADSSRNVRLVAVATSAPGASGDVPFPTHGAGVRFASQPVALTPIDRMVVPRSGSVTCPVELVLSHHEAPQTTDAVTRLAGGELDAESMAYVARRLVSDSAPAASSAPERETDLTTAIASGVAVACQDGSVTVVTPIPKRLADVLTTLEMRLSESALLAPKGSSPTPPVSRAAVTCAGGDGPRVVHPALALLGEQAEPRRLATPIMSGIGVTVVNGDVLDRLRLVAADASPDQSSDETTSSSSAEGEANAAWAELLRLIADDYPLLVQRRGAALRRTLSAIHAEC